MRIHNLLIFILLGLVSCGPVNTKETNDTKAIVFKTTPVQSQSLLVKPTLTGFPKTQRLELGLKLQSLVPEKLTITGVELSNADGINSSDQSISSRAFTISQGRDTTLLLAFNHINNKALFHATGLHGLMDSTYMLSVFYSVAGKEGVRVVQLISTMPGEVFSAYKKSYDIPVHIYHFNTSNGFDEKQRLFLSTNATSKAPPFVHTTEQEMAVSGLNFRVKSFHRKDSVHTEIFVVNHSDMTIRIDNSKLDIIVDPQDQTGHTFLSIEKVTGSKEETDILRKGDRILIRLRKHAGASPRQIWLALEEAFYLSSGRRLFSENVELVRAGESGKE